VASTDIPVLGTHQPIGTLSNLGIIGILIYVYRRPGDYYGR
jgi:hypothetical protein